MTFPDRSVLQARKRMNDAVRRFFDSRGFLEVETPIMVPSPGMEPHLLAFETERIDPSGARSTAYLHTSPEYAMKRLLGRGLGDCYQLARVFRNGERSATHSPEFTMLEWYRAPGTLAAIMDDVEGLIAAVAAAVDGAWQPAVFERLSVSEAFERAGLADPIALTEIEALRAGLEVRTVAGDTWDDVFCRALLDRVEPTFAPDRTTILHGYPASMAALSRIDPADPQRCLRFELYAGAVELANAFDELTDPAEQRRRFEGEQAQRASAGAPVYPIDEGLLADLANIETAAGIALGVDRLLMLCLGLAAIQDVLILPPRDSDGP